MSSTRTTIRGLYVVVVVVFIVALSGWFIPFLNNSGGNGGGTINIIPTTLLSLYDDRIQPLQAANKWTSVVFNTHNLMTGSWSHEIDSDMVIAGTSDTVKIYFSIQAQVDSVTPEEANHFTCKACNLRYLLRATREQVSTGTITEVAGSLTYTGGLSFFLSKEFIVEVEEGDILRFQFYSPCKDLKLYPVHYVHQNATSLVDTFPVSASVIVRS